jgi:protein-tyrosine-phosphatase
MPNVLFVCGANRLRSVIAEEQFRQLLRAYPTAGLWQVESAGTWAEPGLPPLPQALKFCQKHEWSIENIRSREVNQKILANANLILTMTQGQHEALRLEFPQIKRKLFLLSEICEIQKYDISDPSETPDVSWEEVGSEVCALVRNGFFRICRLALSDASKN